MTLTKQDYDRALDALNREHHLTSFDLYAYALACDAVVTRDELNKEAEVDDSRMNATECLDESLSLESGLNEVLLERALELGRELLPRDFPSDPQDERLLVTVQLLSGEQLRYVVPGAMAFKDLREHVASESGSALRSIVDTAIVTPETALDGIAFLGATAP